MCVCWGGGGGLCEAVCGYVYEWEREREREVVSFIVLQEGWQKSVVHDILPVKLRHLQSQTSACQSPAELLFYC